ncbi:hypothetical protein DL96DRAFT_1708361 [Flagelloscypha sp. PMI_526]|nr:hypothetical protein DL96DRAFT_1708361 [Flagelloscypha sp. PMI_526]
MSPIVLLDEEDYVTSGGHSSSLTRLLASSNATTSKRKRTRSPSPVGSASSSSPQLPTTSKGKTKAAKSAPVATSGETKAQRKKRRRAERIAAAALTSQKNSKVKDGSPAVPNAALQKAMAKARANPKHPDNIGSSSSSSNNNDDLEMMSTFPWDMAYAMPSTSTFNPVIMTGWDPSSGWQTPHTPLVPIPSSSSSGVSTSSHSAFSNSLPHHALPQKSSRLQSGASNSPNSALQAGSSPMMDVDTPELAPIPPPGPAAYPSINQDALLSSAAPKRKMGHPPPSAPSSPLGTFDLIHIGVQAYVVGDGGKVQPLPARPNIGRGKGRDYTPNPACTLVLELLPKQRRNVTWIKKWAQEAVQKDDKKTRNVVKFIAIDSKLAKALVEFSSAAITRRAWDSDRLAPELATMPSNRLKGRPRDDLIKAFYFRVPHVIWGGEGDGVGEIEEGEVSEDDEPTIATEDMSMDESFERHDATGAAYAQSPLNPPLQQAKTLSSTSPLLPPSAVPNMLTFSTPSASTLSEPDHIPRHHNLSFAVSSAMHRARLASSAVEPPESLVNASVTRHQPSLRPPSPDKPLPTGPKALQGLPTGPKGMRRVDSPSLPPTPPIPSVTQVQEQPQDPATVGGIEEEKKKALLDLEERLAREKVRLSMRLGRRANAVVREEQPHLSSPTPPISLASPEAPQPLSVSATPAIDGGTASPNSLEDMAESFLTKTIGDLAAPLPTLTPTVATTPPLTALSPAPLTRPFPTNSSVLDLSEKQRRLEAHIQETKILMARLSTATSKEDKTNIMVSIRASKKSYEDFEILFNAANAPVPIKAPSWLSASQPFKWPSTRAEDGILILSDEEDDVNE